MGVKMKLINHLKELGFSQYEAKVYIALLQSSHSTGYELGKISGVPASKIYEVLSKLQDKEVVMALDTEPRKYIPLPPDDVLSRLKAHYLHSIHSLSEALEDIYQKEHQDQHYIWNINGYESVFQKLNDFLTRAVTSIYISIWAEELELIYPVIEELEKRGIRIYIVLFGESPHKIGQMFRHGREHEIRQERGGRRLSLVIDETAMLVSHFKDKGDTIGAYTNNKGMVLLTKDYIIHDIYTIKIYQKFGDEALKIFEKM